MWLSRHLPLGRATAGRGMSAYRPRTRLLPCSGLRVLRRRVLGEEVEDQVGGVDVLGGGPRSGFEAPRPGVTAVRSCTARHRWICRSRDRRCAPLRYRSTFARAESDTPLAAPMLVPPFNREQDSCRDDRTAGPPSYATLGSAVPWNVMTDIGLPCGHGSRKLTPATGAIAAIGESACTPGTPTCCPPRKAGGIDAARVDAEAGHGGLDEARA